ncbi:MAG: carboxypeptidase regulatory-like domain-containing protein, partial [Rhodothermales bacterium]|nr:carboxypeptidase regulatory-like domain-containing protein [Rhodothermales bacterium]
MLLAIVLGAAGVRAQNATVRGFVTDADDGEPLQGVNVILTDAAGGLYGAATDADGLYAVRVPAAIYALRATFIGYAPYTDTLTVAAGEIVTYSFEIRQDQAALDEVVVESEREGAGAASPVAGLQAIRPQDIALIPAPDVSGDLVGYLVTLPGVVATGDQGGQLFVRGGEPTQNLVLLDGMLVYQPFHLVGFYSSFPSTIIQVTDVYAGGFPARYGGRLSSVIDV